MRYLIVALLLTVADGQLTNSVVREAVYAKTYIAGVPRVIRRGFPADVFVHILKKDSPVNVTVQLLRAKVVTEVTQVVQAGKPTILTLQVPDALPIPSTYYIIVRGQSSSVNFVNLTSVQLENAALKVFIQTDKPVYKPNQTVFYRIFILQPDLKIFKGSYTIIIRNPDDVLIKYNKEGYDPTGLLNRSLALTNGAPGQWSIKVITGFKKLAASVTFTVKEYELPLIEVTVTPPSFITRTQSTVEVTVTAKSLFGEKAHGSLSVIAKYRQNEVLREVNNFLGSATVIFSLADILDTTDRTESRRNRNGKTLIFEASLTDSTGAVTSNRQQTNIHEVAETVTYRPFSPVVFKPGLTFRAYAKVMKHDGSRIDQQLIPEKLKVLVQQSYYGYACKLVHGDIVLVGTETTECTLQLEYKTVNLTIMELIVPADGLVNINIPSVPAKAERIDIISTYKGQTALLSAQKAYSPSNSFIQIDLLYETLQPGQIQKIVMRFSFSIQSFITLVISRGRIVKTTETTLHFTSTFHSISFEITQDMGPLPIVVVYYRTVKGEIVSDAAFFQVLNYFKNNVSIDFDAAEVRQGDDVNINVKADSNSLVATLVVDKKVYLVDPGKNLITKERIHQDLVDSDLSISEELTTAIDAFSVFNAAGFIILTDCLLYKHTSTHPTIVIRSNNRYSIDKSGVDTDSNDGSELQPVTNLATKSPETWLFSAQFTSNNGQVTFPTTAPDSSTVWIATAFAFNDQSGFGITSEAATLTVV